MKRYLLLAALFSAPGWLGALDDAEAVARIEQATRKQKEVSRTWSPAEPIFFWPEAGGKILVAPEKNAPIESLVAIDPEDGVKQKIFDEDKVATALAAAGAGDIKRLLRAGSLIPTAAGIRMRVKDRWWEYDPATDTARPSNQPDPIIELLPPGADWPDAPQGAGEVPFEVINRSRETIELVWINRRERKSYARVEPGARHRQSSFTGHRWIIRGPDNRDWGRFVVPESESTFTVTGPIPQAPPSRARENSPDGKWTIEVSERTLKVRASAAAPVREIRASLPEGAIWERHTLEWSPRSTHFALRFRIPVRPRQIHIIESSPGDQLQPKLLTLNYNKPGDPIDGLGWRVFNVADARMLPGDDSLTPHPWSLDNGAWRPDGREFTFMHHQRGHQVLRLIGLDPATGKTREILGDHSKTFIDYSQKQWMLRLPEENEILRASERDGWNHLYLHDATTGAVKRQITRGPWNVRSVENVDEEKRTLLLRVVGFHPGQDPYHEHWIRVPIDGGPIVPLTDADGTHRIRFSPDGRFLVATWSRVDHPPVVELRRADTGKKLATFASPPLDNVRALGWQPPVPFHAPGRDGTTLIYGHITLPTGFDPSRKYPVVENIYAGPHDHHVRKNFAIWDLNNSIAELGFVVVSIDGMGTNWRNKAFHDVAWKNLMDAGFPDRIAWIKAAAATRPWMDLQRIGIFGGSAGGQNALAALLNHGDFYKVAVADCGCHDNRMDKLWWNEAWMGWPVDESYARNSNVTHAAKLQGKLMLIVGELDTNVDPASTMQVVGALQKAGKDFDFVPVVGAGHGAAESPYGRSRRARFLMRHLQP